MSRWWHKGDNLEYCKLKDIATIYNGNSINKTVKKQKYMQKVPGWNYISTKDVDFDGTVQYENGVIIPYAETKFRVAPAGSVFVCSEGGSAGRKTAIITEDVCFGNKLFAIVNDRNRYVGKYLYYFTRYSGFTKQFKLLATSLMGGISAKNFGAIEVPLPSLEEQDKIIRQIEELFSELDKGVETLQTIKGQLAVYQQTVLKNIFENIVDTTRLDTVAFMIDPQPSHRTPPEAVDGISYIGIGDIDYAANRIDFASSRKVSPDVLKEHLLRYTLHDGDFVMGKIGTIGNPFRVVLPQDYALSANVILIQPNKQVIDPNYLFWQFSSPYITEQLSKGSVATSQPAFGIKKARALSIRICPMESQAKIVEEIESRLSVCDSIEKTVDTALAQAEAMRQSILKKAFEGELCK